MGFFAVDSVNPGPPTVIRSDPTVSLRRRVPTGRSERPDFLLSEPFGYRHEPAENDERPLEIVVPSRIADSASDLASVPTWLGWIAAKTGPNLPAALVHDVLVVETDRDGNLEVDSDGKPITPVNHWWRKDGQKTFTEATNPYEPADRRRADRIFRDGMGDAGVDAVRRWLMWAAVAAATLWDQRPRGWRGRIDAVRFSGLIVLVLAGASLLPYVIFDLANFSWVPSPSEGGIWADLRDAGLLAAALTAIACTFTGLRGTERHQWVLGLLVPAAALLSWAVAATLLGGLLLGLIRLVGRTRHARYAGQIIHFYDQIGVAIVELEGTGVEVGDRVSVLGHTTAVKNRKIESMELDREPVEQMVKGKIAIKVAMDPGTRLRPGDRLYRLERVTGRRDR